MNMTTALPDGKSLRLPDGRTMTLKSHWCYCRKCIRQDHLGGIYLTQQSRGNSVFVEVLAVGPLVGTKRIGHRWAEWLKLPRHRRPCRHQESIKVGQILKLLDIAEVDDGAMPFPWPNPHGIVRSPFAPKDEEFFIDETSLKVAIEPQEE
jgi:hypothetical protein